MAEERSEEERRKANKVDLGMGISRRPLPAELKRSQQEKEAEELREKLAEQERQQGIDWLKAKLAGDTRNFPQWLAAQRNQETQPAEEPEMLTKQPTPGQKPKSTDLPDPAPGDEPWLAVQKADKKYKPGPKYKNSGWWKAMIPWFLHYSTEIDTAFHNKELAKWAGTEVRQVQRMKAKYGIEKK